MRHIIDLLLKTIKQMITGQNIIGYKFSSEGQKIFRAFDPKKNQELPEIFYSATKDEVEKAIKKACNAYEIYKHKQGKAKALFLRAIAGKIFELGNTLIERAMSESGLSEGRLRGERDRTINQLRLFATLLEEGSWTEAIIDLAIPERKPSPRPDIRKILRPIGPVAVFSASNFPLAFSTAGGDTTSALAAGNPVIVKAHSFHPGTNELVGTAIIEAAKQTGMPEGVFSTINTVEHEIGQAIVMHPKIKAVGFTGSFSGGMDLFTLAQKREEPIPVFAEMGSVNPTILLPGKLKEDAKSMGELMAGSITIGAGQFCTNPGIIISLVGKETDEFITALSEKIKSLHPEPMLHPRIKKNYKENIQNILSFPKIELVAESNVEEVALEGRPMVTKVGAQDFIANPKLAEEIFGPYSLIVLCTDKTEILNVVKKFKGQLTATIMANEEDVKEFNSLIIAMQEVSGRLIFNGVPTGVEVCYAMQHGGPFPASTYSRFTSVGTDAIKRFVRPVAYQDAPDSYLPNELKNANPLGIWRLVNGTLTKNNI
jgi:2,5-dioxopentanoate dehydrogenase